MKIEQSHNRRRWFFNVSLVAPIAITGCIGRPSMQLWQTNSTEVNRRQQSSEAFLDDASKLNQTQVAEVWPVPETVGDAEKQLSMLLARAKSEGLKVSIGGAQHSMGGHTMYPGGIAINMLPLNSMWLDSSRNLLHVGAGALWRDVIPYLDAHGRSVSVMQSNNSFSVGGSISVNCHGWQFNRPKTESGESRMQTTTRHLIDAALAVDGRYYLPYRLHATARQFHQAYPQAMKFFELKLKYDPDELFQSSFYCKYSGR